MDNTISLEKLQQLRQTYPAPTGRDVVRDTSQPSPLGWAKLQRPFRPLAPNAGRIYLGLDPEPAMISTCDPNERTEGAMYLSPGQRPGNQDTPHINDRPERAAYNPQQITRSSQNKKMQNKPILEMNENPLTHYPLMPNANCLTPVPTKNKPIINPRGHGPPDIPALALRAAVKPEA